MKKPRIHLEIQNHRSSPIGVLRTTFRDPESGKIRHTQHGRITGVPLQTLLNVQAALKDEVVRCDDPDAFRVLGSRELGASAALLELAKDIGLSTCLYSRPQEQWVQDALAMIVGRITYQGSKLALSQTSNISALWELCGVHGKVDVDEHCYEVMDRLLERQDAIQKHLAAKHLNDGCIVLYDITSSYLEGEYEGSEIVQFGYNRDGKRGHEQIVIGLLTDEKGCPFAMEVFPGNTQDAATVTAKIKELRNTYGLKEVVFVGDRGMITKSTEAKLESLPEAEGFKIVSALTHRQIVDLLAKKKLEPSVFDDRNIVEIIDTQDHNRRYCLCRNPYVAEKSAGTRRSLLERTKQGLTKIKDRKTKGDAAKLGAQVGKLLAKTKMGKFIDWAVKEGRLEWSVKEEDVAAEAAMDGCYVIKATVPKEDMSKETVVSVYKSLQHVERAFRSMKTVKIELRPIYHRKDERIKAHAFLCMLAYYLLWHMKERLEPLFSKQEEEIVSGKRERKDRNWTVDNVLENLKTRRRNLMSCQGQEFSKDMEADAVQAEILKLLKTPPPPTVEKGGEKAA